MTGASTTSVNTPPIEGEGASGSPLSTASLDEDPGITEAPLSVTAEVGHLQDCGDDDALDMGTVAT